MRKALALILALLICCSSSFGKERPSLVITKKEAAVIKAELGKYPLFDRSFASLKKQLETALASPMAVPPPGEGGEISTEIFLKFIFRGSFWPIIEMHWT